MYLLEVDRIKKNSEGKTLINGLSFNVSEKGVYGVLGKANSGKTVLAEILAGACRIDEGSVSYKEQKLYESEKQSADIKKKIGYVASSCFFDRDITVFEAIDLLGKSKSIDPDKRFRQIKEALELTGLSLRTETLIGELAPNDRKRLMLAASLLGNPDVIIMDEPLRGFEKKQAEDIKNIISMLGRKKLVIMFSSRPDEIEELCANIAILHEGQIVAEYEKEALLTVIRENNLGSLANVLDALTEDKEEK